MSNKFSIHEFRLNNNRDATFFTAVYMPTPTTLPTDCADLKKAGFVEPGFYYVNPKVGEFPTIKVFCENGATYFLKRDAGPDVNPVSINPMK